MNCRTFQIVPAVTIWLALAGRGVADVSNVTGTAHIEAKAQVMILPENGPDPSPSRQTDLPPDVHDLTDFERSASADASKDGFVSRGRAQQRAKLQVGANKLVFTASGSTEGTASQSSDPHHFIGGVGTWTFEVGFEIDSESTFSLLPQGSVSAIGTTDSSEAEVSLTGRTTDGQLVNIDFDAADAKGKRTSISGSKSGSLKPGQYSLFVLGLSDASESMGSSRTTTSVSFSLDSPKPIPDPDDGTEIHWVKQGGGNFLDPANWKPQRVPTKVAGRSDTAVFDLRGNQTVDIPAAAAPEQGTPAPVVIERLVVRDSLVGMGGSGVDAAGDTVIKSSIVVNDDGVLLFSSGKFFSKNATIQGRSTAAILNVNRATWNNSGKIRVLDRAFLTVQSGGSMTSSETVLGGKETRFSGEGTTVSTGDLTIRSDLIIKSGASVFSDSAVMLSRGPIDVRCSVEGGQTQPASADWLIRETLDMNGGPGLFLFVLNGGNVSCGKLLVGASPHRAEIDVGSNSNVKCSTATLGRSAQVTVNPGATFTASSLSMAPGAKFILGTSLTNDPVQAKLEMFTAFGSVTVGTSSGPPATLGIGNSALADVWDLEIGSGSAGNGIVDLVNNSEVLDTHLTVRGNMQVGSDQGGTGLLNIANADVEVLGNLRVGRKGLIAGVGNIAVTGNVTIAGRISPSLLVFDPAKLPADHAATPALLAAAGTLSINGAFEQTADGSVEVLVSGPTPGTGFGQLQINGDSILDGKLVLKFVGGYAPKTGESFRVINTTGGVTGGFAAMEVSGLKSGAQFTTAPSTGGLEIQTLNDTEALPVVNIKAVGRKTAKERPRTPGVFIISRTGDKSAPLTVQYQLGGRAENGIDYVFLPGTVTIPKNKAAVTVRVKPFDDKDFEGDETVSLTVVPTSDYTHALLAAETITIRDNERLRTQ